MTPGQSKIIARLRQGPLLAKDYEAVGAASGLCLRVQVHKLREQGFNIQTVRADGKEPQGSAGHQGNVPGKYVLANVHSVDEVAALRRQRDELHDTANRYLVRARAAEYALAAALASPPVSERERELEGALKLAKERIQSWPIDDHETCMCGSLVEDHDIGSGHSPVSQADHAVSTIVQEIDRALTTQPAGEGK